MFIERDREIERERETERERERERLGSHRSDRNREPAEAEKWAERMERAGYEVEKGVWCVVLLFSEERDDESERERERERDSSSGLLVASSSPVTSSSSLLRSLRLFLIPYQCSEALAACWLELEHPKRAQKWQKLAAAKPVRTLPGEVRREPEREREREREISLLLRLRIDSASHPLLLVMGLP